MAISHSSTAHAVPVKSLSTTNLYQRRRSSFRQGPFHVVTPPAEPHCKPCPRDGDAFAYDPKNLRVWYLSADLWSRLPSRLRASLAAMQHAGAAVLTGFERLEALRGSVDEAEFDTVESLSRAAALEDATPSDDMTPGSSNASSPAVAPVSMMTPVSLLQLPASGPRRSLSSDDAPNVASHDVGNGNGAGTARRHHRRSFTTPVTPHCAYFLAELSSLRSDALVRLRHSARRVDAEWAEARREGTYPILKNPAVYPTGRRDSATSSCTTSTNSTASTTDDDDAATASLPELEFEAWWEGKKSLISALDNRGRLLAQNLSAGMQSGWGA